MTLDDLINATIVCGDPVTVVSFNDDGNEVTHFEDFSDQLSDSDFGDNEEVLEREVTYIEARTLKGKPTLLITIEND